jgi:hypothetical protein
MAKFRPVQEDPVNDDNGRSRKVMQRPLEQLVCVEIM